MLWLLLTISRIMARVSSRMARIYSSLAALSYVFLVTMCEWFTVLTISTRSWMLKLLIERTLRDAEERLSATQCQMLRASSTDLSASLQPWTNTLIHLLKRKRLVTLSKLLLLVGRAGRPRGAKDRLSGRYSCKHFFLLKFKLDLSTIFLNVHQAGNINRRCPSPTTAWELQWHISI